MMHTDPPEHTRYRKLVQPGFAPKVIRALEEPLRAQVAALLDAFDAAGRSTSCRRWPSRSRCG